ncbi:unnamed protein product [Coregonus sp. 'balchen']|nr:unnamed protein product [Coregonus sp. 'balchen']
MWGIDDHLRDDGKLSLEEFQSYFADGILTTEQMQELFYSIDRQQTDNLDMDTLSEFFSPHLGEYLNVLSALEKLNVAILKAMDTTKEEYQGSSVLGQFVTRFLLRETNTQLQSLQLSLDCTMEAVDEQSCTGSNNNTVAVDDDDDDDDNDDNCVHCRKIRKPEDLSLQRIAKRPSRVSVEPDNHHWSSQANRLQQLIDKLEYESPHLEPLNEDTLAGTYNSNILLVQRQMSVKDKDTEEFQQALKIYTDATTLPERSCFIMYEFWQDRFSWMSYLQSPISKTFHRCIIDVLEDPEMVSTMLLPVVLQ